MHWEQIRGDLVPLAVSYGSRVAGVLLLFLTGWIVAGWLKGMVERAMIRARVDITLARFLAGLTRWTILVLAALACLGVFGVDTTSFAAMLGAAGLAIGLALQGTLSNLAAGLMLLVFRPFKVGDVITTAGQTGMVDAIDLFSTIIDTLDNRRFIVPNGAIFGSVIENITYHPVRRADVTVGVSYAADIDHTREVLTQAIRTVPGILPNPAPAIVLMNLSASSVDWSVRVWTKSVDFGDVRQATLRAVKSALVTGGAEIPFPQMDARLKPRTPPA